MRWEQVRWAARDVEWLAALSEVGNVLVEGLGRVHEMGEGVHLQCGTRLVDRAHDARIMSYSRLWCT